METVKVDLKMLEPRWRFMRNVVLKYSNGDLGRLETSHVG